ncbi:MAG: hypothetical protein HEQ35_06085 [Gloeotrichia echinulata IR180]
MEQQIYCIHKVNLRFSTDSPALSSAVKMLLCPFEQNNLSEAVALQFVFKEVKNRSEIPFIVSPSGQMISSRSGRFFGDSLRSTWKCDFYRLMTIKIADLGEDGIMLIDHQRGQVEGYLVNPDIRHPEVLATFFYLALNELLKKEGLYGLHAAALEKDGHGFLFPGFSGSGKTTCCISLLNNGYRYISDDHILLRENNAGFDILNFPIRLDNRIFLESFFQENHNRTGIATLNATKKTITFFPQLTAAKGYPYQEEDKRFFFVEDISPYPPADSSKVNYIIFPKILDYPKSYLEHLPKSRALEELLPQSLLVFDQDIARKHFHFLSRLVEKSECYRLHFGEDVLEFPQLIDTLLANI